MNILAPVNHMEAAVDLIDAGAAEIYLGADDELFSLYSFTGRGKIGYSGITMLNQFAQTKEIIDYAHSKMVKVNFLGNAQFFHNGSFQNKELESYFLDYIEKGIEIGADVLVIGDLGLLQAVSKRNYGVELHASVYFRTVNEQQLLFLKGFGISRTTLSYQITMDEIIDLCGAGIMDIEVMGYLGCSFFNGACGFLHEFGEGILDDFDPGVACKGLYHVNDGQEVTGGKIFDAEAGCAICKLGELESAGVKSLKIVGRGRDHKPVAQVIKLYQKFLGYYREGFSFHEKQAEIPGWWRKLWCSKERCKYKSGNPNHTFIIGR
jgi:putative protease